MGVRAGRGGARSRCRRRRRQIRDAPGPFAYARKERLEQILPGAQLRRPTRRCTWARPSTRPSPTVSRSARSRARPRMSTSRPATRSASGCARSTRSTRRRPACRCPRASGSFAPSRTSGRTAALARTGGYAPVRCVRLRRRRSSRPSRLTVSVAISAPVPYPATLPTVFLIIATR